jgi:hypothetical protein
VKLIACRADVLLIVFEILFFHICDYSATGEDVSNSIPDGLRIGVLLVDVGREGSFPLAGEVAVEAVELVGAGRVAFANM